MNGHKNKTAAFHELQKLLTDFSNPATVRKIELLNECSAVKSLNKKTVLQYHNSLLFLLSHPENEQVYQAATRAMDRLISLLGKKKALKDQLTGSGIAGTAIQSAFSLTLTKWLLEKFAGEVTLHSIDKEGVHPRDFLKYSLNEAEFELVNDEKPGGIRWLQKASGTKNRNKILHWLTRHFETIRTDKALKEQLYESMGLFTEIKTNDKSFSRTYGALKTGNIYFHREGLVKKFNERELINKKLPLAKVLTPKEKQNLIDVSRTALCMLNRETDPVTYCEDLEYYELERGLSIALFSMDNERKLPLESYIGFMMFKNGYPMSYGGAWLFGRRALIGINIFEAFRGGESAIVFAQLLRCYKMAFGATFFEVEPYQFGKNNPEGILSGAFWLYYRFGFRPCDKKLFSLAEQEKKKIENNKTYRTPPEILKRFTASNLFVCLDDSTQAPPDPQALSKFVTLKVNSEFNGDREKAVSAAVKKLEQEKILSGKTNAAGLKKLGLILACCLNFQALSEKRRAVISKMINEKGASEFDYVRTLRGFEMEKSMNSEALKFTE